jgi:hypothetical protein
MLNFCVSWKRKGIWYEQGSCVQVVNAPPLCGSTGGGALLGLTVNASPVEKYSNSATRQLACNIFIHELINLQMKRHYVNT